MATQELTGALERTDREGDTAPLSPVAAALLARLQAEFPVVRAVAQYETAAEHAAQLAGLAESGRMADLDADSLAAAEDVMAAARTVLAAAGQLHLVEVDPMAADLARLMAAQATADRIAAQVGDWDGGEAPRLMVAVIDPETNTRMATTFATIRPEPARPLRIVADHEKTKYPLPQRPRGPHPYLTGEAS